jgi:hypothetical protein
MVNQTGGRQEIGCAGVIGVLGVVCVFASWLGFCSTSQAPPVASIAPLSAPSMEHISAGNDIDRKLQQGIIPTEQDIDNYTIDPEQRKAMRAFYGLDR